MERIPVLHVVDCLDVGGTERQMFELLSRLDRSRFRPLLACFKAKGELTAALRTLDIEPMEFPLRGRLAQPNTFVQVGRMARLAARERVGIIHAHDFYSNLIGVSAARLARVPAIASRRDLAHWLSPWKREALRLSLRLADRVLANAEAVGARTVREEQVAREKLRVVPNGLDVTRFDALAARAPDGPLPPRTGRPRIVMVASMHLVDKGHGDLIEAAARLRARGVDADWIFVSDGVLRPAHEAEARRRGLGATFLGRRRDVPAILAACDLAVHPSWAEGFPNAVLEAMAAGLPVVATRVGGIPEVTVAGETALLVEPRDPLALADAIGTLLADPARAQAMGRAGRRRVEEVYSLERMTARVEALYDELALIKQGTLRGFLDLPLRGLAKPAPLVVNPGTLKGFQDLPLRGLAKPAPLRDGSKPRP